MILWKKGLQAFLALQNQMLKWTVPITWHNFLHFDLLFKNHWAKLDKTWMCNSSKIVSGYITRHPRWLLWPLIAWKIGNLWKVSGWNETKFDPNIIMQLLVFQHYFEITLKLMKYNSSFIMRYLTFIVLEICPFIMGNMMFFLFSSHYLQLLLSDLTKRVTLG
jgi:hypothetical protein